MAKSLKNQVVTYQLKKARFETIRNDDGTESRIVAGQSNLMLPCIQTIIRWNKDRTDYEFVEMTLNKETKRDNQLKTNVPSQDNPIIFSGGLCRIFLPRDRKQYDFLEASRWNETNPDRLDTDEVIFFRVDEQKEKQSTIADIDRMVEAYSLIANAKVEDLVEYAKAMNIECGDVEEILRNAKMKDKVKDQDSYKELVLELKMLAKKSADNFVSGFDNPLRPYLSVINESVKYNQVLFDKMNYAYFWQIGQNKQLIVNVPQGILATEDWFAGWLMENLDVLNEMKAKVQTAKMTSK